MADKIKAAHKGQIEDLKLVASGGGCFELSLDGELVYSKLQTGTFPDDAAMVKLIGERLK